MPDKESELEKEWRQAISTKLNNMEDILRHVEISLAEIGAAKLVNRVEALETEIEGLKTFKTKIITAVIVIQTLLGFGLAVLSHFL